MLADDGVLGTGGQGMQYLFAPSSQGACWWSELSHMSQKRQKAGAVFKFKEKMLQKE